METTDGHSLPNNVSKFELKINEMRKLPIVALYGILEIWPNFLFSTAYWLLVFKQSRSVLHIIKFGTAYSVLL